MISQWNTSHSMSAGTASHDGGSMRVWYSSKTKKAAAAPNRTISIVRNSPQSGVRRSQT